MSLPNSVRVSVFAPLSANQHRTQSVSSTYSSDMTGSLSNMKTSCVGSITTTIKATNGESWRIRKGDYVVAKSLEIVDARNKKADCTILVTPSLQDAKAIQTQLVKLTGASLLQKQAGLAAARRAVQVTVDMTGLKKIHNNYSIDILRDGLEAIAIDDIAKDHWAVGKSYEVTNWIHGPGLLGYSGTVDVTGFNKESEMLTLSFPSLGTSENYLPIELVGVIEGFVDNEHDDARGGGNPPGASGGGDASLLVIDLTGLPNALVLSKRFPGPVRAKHAAVCDILRLAMSYTTPKTRVTGHELIAMTRPFKRALALEYIKELETVLEKYCTSASLRVIPQLPPLTPTGDAWDILVASWLAEKIQGSSPNQPPLSDDYFDSSAFAIARPRAKALYNTAIDVGHFIKLLKSLGASDSLDLSAHEAASCGVISLAGALDRTLMKFGESASPSRLAPAVIGHDDLLTTDQMLDKFYDLRGTRKNPEQDSNNHRDSKRVQYVGATPIDCSGTETEQSVRNVTLAAGLAIGGSPAEMKSLKEIEDCSDNPSAMRSLIEASSADVQRVLLWAETPAPVLTGHIDVGTVNTIAMIRGTLSKSYRTALLGDDPASKEPTQKHVKALEWIRIGRPDKAQLLHLLGKEGAWTIEEPLKSFQGMTDGLAMFFKAWQMVEQAWITAKPAWASQILTASQRLTTAVTECFEEGGDFTVICPWYRSVLRAWTKHTAAYASRMQTMAGLPPSTSVITETNNPWNIQLRKDVAKMSQAAIADQRMDERGVGGLSEVQRENAALKKRLDALERKGRDRSSDKRQRETEEKHDVKGEKKPKKAATSDKKNKEANIAAAKAAEGVGTFDGRSNRAQMKHLADTIGKVGDKLPCLFFHTESCKTTDRPLGCNKSAEECRFHHQA